MSEQPARIEAPRRHSRERRGRIVGALIVGALAVIVELHDLHDFRGSTGAVGDILFPFIALLLVVLGSLVGGMVGWLMDRRAQ